MPAMYSDFLLLKAKVLIQLSRDSQALTLLTQVESLGFIPTPQIDGLRYRSYLRQKKFKKALETAIALADDPFDFIAIGMVVNVYKRLKEFENGLQFLKSAKLKFEENNQNGADELRFSRAQSFQHFYLGSFADLLIELGNSTGDVKHYVQALRAINERDRTLTQNLQNYDSRVNYGLAAKALIAIARTEELPDKKIALPEACSRYSGET